MGAALVSLDFFKAYDRLYLPFLLKVLEKMNCRVENGALAAATENQHLTITPIANAALVFNNWCERRRRASMAPPPPPNAVVLKKWSSFTNPLLPV